MYIKFKIGQSEHCPCQTSSMTTEHLLQECPLHNILRTNFWLQPETLEKKIVWESDGSATHCIIRFGDGRSHLEVNEKKKKTMSFECIEKHIFSGISDYFRLFLTHALTPPITVRPWLSCHVGTGTFLDLAGYYA